MIEPKNSLIKQYKEVFKLDGCELSLTEEAIDKIVEKAFKLKLGARGLRGICENLFREELFHIPSTGKTTLTIDGEYINQHLK